MQPPRLPGVRRQAPRTLCAAGLPVARGGQTVPSQAPLCFDPGSPAGDRTEGKKKGRPKAENQALRDIPVSSLRAGVGLAVGPACGGRRPPWPATRTSGTRPTSGHHGAQGTMSVGTPEQSRSLPRGPGSGCRPRLKGLVACLP